MESVSYYKSYLNKKFAAKSTQIELLSFWIHCLQDLINASMAVDKFPRDRFEIFANSNLHFNLDFLIGLKLLGEGFEWNFSFNEFFAYLKNVHVLINFINFREIQICISKQKPGKRNGIFSQIISAQLKTILYIRC